MISKYAVISILNKERMKWKRDLGVTDELRKGYMMALTFAICAINEVNEITALRVLNNPRYNKIREIKSYLGSIARKRQI